MAQNDLVTDSDPLEHRRESVSPARLLEPSITVVRAAVTAVVQPVPAVLRGRAQGTCSGDVLRGRAQGRRRPTTV
jgi:hypothetical protein